MHVNRRIVIPALNGAQVEIDLSAMEMTKAQRSVVDKMLASGSISALSVKERNEIGDLRVSIGLTAAEEGPIVRFDCKWIRIDRRSPNLEDIGAKQK